jgi:hypothetical protein
MCRQVSYDAVAWGNLATKANLGTEIRFASATLTLLVHISLAALRKPETTHYIEMAKASSADNPNLSSLSRRGLKSAAVLTSDRKEAAEERLLRQDTP